MLQEKGERLKVEEKTLKKKWLAAPAAAANYEPLSYLVASTSPLVLIH